MANMSGVITGLSALLDHAALAPHAERIVDLFNVAQYALI
jgi:hypothetical protein